MAVQGKDRPALSANGRRRRMRPLTTSQKNLGSCALALVFLFPIYFCHLTFSFPFRFFFSKEKEKKGRKESQMAERNWRGEYEKEEFPRGVFCFHHQYFTWWDVVENKMKPPRGNHFFFHLLSPFFFQHFILSERLCWKKREKEVLDQAPDRHWS